jgi:amino acid transporter
MESRPLKRVLGPWAVVAFGVTNQIAAGLFFVTTQIQQTVPGVDDLVPWLMLAGGAITMLVALAYRYFFACGVIGAGGEYEMLRDALGARIAFVATLLSWFGMTGAVGTLAYVAPRFLSSACAGAGWNAPAAFLASTPGTFTCGLALLWLVWLVHVRSVRFAAILTVAAMVLVVLVALTMTGYGFATTAAHFAGALSARLHIPFNELVAYGSQSRRNTLAAVTNALPLLFFAYLGLSSATQTGGEATDARRSLSRGVIVAVVLVTVIYVLFTFAVYHAVPWQAIVALSARGLTTYTTSTGLLGVVMPGWLGSLMNVFVAAIVMKTLLPIFLAQSRWIYAWGRDGIIPVRFAKTHARFYTPVLALTISAALGSLSLLESTTVGYVFGVSLRVFSSMIVVFLIGVGMLFLPRTAPDLHRANSSWLGRARFAQIAIAGAIMAFALWFSIALIYGARTQPVLLQPVVQAAIVAGVGLLIMRPAALRRDREAAATGRARPGI